MQEIGTLGLADEVAHGRMVLMSKRAGPTLPRRSATTGGRRPARAALEVSGPRTRRTHLFRSDQSAEACAASVGGGGGVLLEELDEVGDVLVWCRGDVGVDRGAVLGTVAGNLHERSGFDAWAD